MQEKVRERILKVMSILPIVRTKQIANLFKENGSPNKRASESLRELELEKRIEGVRRGDMQKIWRLTRKAKQEMEIQRPAIPLSSMKCNHFLAIADVYFSLMPRYFQVELREPFLKRVYAPDMLYFHEGTFYLGEVQLSPMSRKQWVKKWHVANTYFNNRYFEKASWQRWKKNDYIKPKFVVYTNQNEAIVKEGFEVHQRELLVKKIPIL